MNNSELIYNVERAIEHDNRAIETLYKYTYSRMYALVYGLCCNKNDVEDILQEGYTTAFLKINTLDEKKAFYSWLRKIIINTWRNYSRKKTIKHTNSTYETEIYDLENQMIEPSPYDVVEDAIIREQILKIVESLPENQRVCIVLYYYDNMNMDEIADALDIPLGSVKSRLHYGRKRLCSAIKEDNLFSLNLLIPIATADKANSNIFTKVMTTLEAASKGTSAAAAAKTAGSGLALKLGISLISFTVVTGIIVYPHLNTPQPKPAVNLTTPVPTVTTTAAITTSATAVVTTATTEITTTTTVPTAVTTAPQSFSAFQYKNVSGGVAITKYIGSDSHLSIPSEIDGQSVIAIEDKAFAYCTVLKSVTIPDSVNSIGINSFRECNNLSFISFSGVSNIGDMAFVGCESLQSITLPPSVRSVGIYAFAYCTSLKEVVISQGTQTLRYNAFYNCPNLQSITLPASINRIGENVFTGTSSNLVIYAPSGSYVQTYAEENGYTYISS